MHASCDEQLSKIPDDAFLFLHSFRPLQQKASPVVASMRGLYTIPYRCERLTDLQEYVYDGDGPRSLRIMPNAAILL